MFFRLTGCALLLSNLLPSVSAMAQIPPSSATPSNKAQSAGTFDSRTIGYVNVQNFGAALNGTIDDSAAFNAARTAAGRSYPIILVPPGAVYLHSSPTHGFSGTDLWELSGNTLGRGRIPITGIGHDIVESFMGSKYFGRGGTHPDSGSVVRIDDNVNNIGGKFGDTTSTLEVNTNIPIERDNLNDSAWGITSVLNSYSKGPAENVAVVGFSYKKADGSAVWGANFSGSDTTGDNSSISGATIGGEIDVSAWGGLDNGGSASKVLPARSGIRVGLDVDLFEKHGATIGWGIRVNGPNVARGVAVNSRDVTQAAFDTEFSTIAPGANAYRMASDQTIGFDKNGIHALGYTGTSLAYKISGKTEVNISEEGDLTLSGHLMSAGATPTIGSCGSTLEPVRGSTDIAGGVSIPAGTKKCTIAFAAPYSVAPFISLGQIGVNADAFIETKSASTFTISIASQASSVEIDWIVN